MHLILEGCCQCVIGIGPCQFEFWGPKLRQTCLDCLQQSFFNYLYTTCSTAINKPFQLNRFKKMCGSHLKTQGAAVRTWMTKVITCSSITFKDEIICSFTTSFLDYLTWNLNVEDGVRHGQHGLHWSYLYLNMTIGQDSGVGCFAYNTFHVQRVCSECLEVVTWRFEQRTFYIDSLRVRLISACQEVLKSCVWPSSNRNRLLFIWI